MYGSSESPKAKSSRVTTLSIRAAKSENRKLVAVTAYDFTCARLMDEAVDILLVGDSLGMVIQGNEDTLSVTVDDVVYHSKAVARAAKKAHLVADMPFMSYQAGIKQAVKNAGRLLSEGRAQSVKLEGGTIIAKTISRLVKLGIPVMGHVGLTPQSVHVMGGFKVQGKTEATRKMILEDAMAVEAAGAYSLVLEGIPTELAKEITERVSIPTIGIGAGPFCDGQVLVMQDLLGMNPNFRPKFVKSYTDGAALIQKAVCQYSDEVRGGKFPDESHSF